MKISTLKKLNSLTFASHISVISTPSSQFSSSSSSPFPESSPFIVEYLVRSLGCSKETAINASKRLLHINSPEKPDSILAFLRGLGLSQSQLSFAVLRRPLILTHDIKATLIPKIELFQSIGAFGKELAHLVSSSTICFGNSVDSRILPSVNFLRNILHDDKKVRLAIKRCPRILTNDPEKTQSRNVEFLREKGLDMSLISAVVRKSPRVLVLKLEQLDLAWKIVEESGFCPTDANYADALHVVTNVSKENLLRKLEILRSSGFGEFHMSMLLRLPQPILRLNEMNFKRKLDFFLNVIDCDPRELINYPMQMGLSLEGRLMPRFRWIRNLQSKGLYSGKVNFRRAFLMTEEKFANAYVHKFKDGDGLDLVEAYKNFDLKEVA